MKHLIYLHGFVLVALSVFCQPVKCADQITLQFIKPHAEGEIVVHSKITLPVSGMYPEYVIQQSSNMVNWTTVAGPISGSVGVSDEFLRVSVPTTGNHVFYRVVANV